MHIFPSAGKQGLETSIGPRAEPSSVPSGQRREGTCKPLGAQEGEGCSGSVRAPSGWASQGQPSTSQTGRLRPRENDVCSFMPPSIPSSFSTHLLTAQSMRKLGDPFCPHRGHTFPFCLSNWEPTGSSGGGVCWAAPGPCRAHGRAQFQFGDFLLSGRSGRQDCNQCRSRPPPLPTSIPRAIPQHTGCGKSTLTLPKQLDATL